MDKNLNALEVKNISKSFNGKQALKKLDFVIKYGEIFGFLGPSGAGKTTTIKMMTGQLEPSGGEAFILGRNAKNITAEIYGKIGLVTDNSGVYEKLTVAENMKVYCNIHNVPVSEANRLLKRVGLENDKKKPAEKLSKGMKQRLVLARALVHSPEILFLDEPTSGLDPSTSLAIHELLLEVRNSGTAIFLTTHNMEEAYKLCDNLALINEGVIVEQGKPKEIILKHNQKQSFEVMLDNNENISFQEDSPELETLFDLIRKKRVKSIHSSEPTLEDVFIKLTGRVLSNEY
ncbi:ABC transporter ATP-binding protein [Miniphocaeibacter halophilus]|uniref:ABC transporter ATP-binding protein n=1 Tax=Miniphocaeibacter halophilus TaxID=2931922 RepID=A0AC61MP13_9FIRM|nr:ABC transporter ATP-binding protein [Miniphocaeibacter halophilus]QQK07239.1 ABC transporter ATP-binding protein [Miniphocaeibacter halophilus]